MLIRRKGPGHKKILEYWPIFSYYVRSGGFMLREKVEVVLEKVRVGLKSEGGDIDLIDVKDDIVYVKLKGACGTCPMSTLTMKNWVESSIKKEIPEIKAVQAV
jgi:Fe-S cluster biogenesis protein NfuA